VALESGLDKDPFQEKYVFSSINRVPAIRIEYIRARWKGLSTSIVLNLRPMVICVCGLLSNPKSQNSNFWHDGTLSIRNFMLMLKKPMDPNFETLSSKSLMAMSRPKFKNSNISMMVLPRSKILH
jgi:hypothetical protein